MANSKISALTSATTPLAGTETLPIVQSSTTKQVSVANLTAGRAVSVSSLSVSGTGAALALTQNSAGSATYYIMDTTVETGGKRWRFGYSGATTFSNFSFYNQTDNVTVLNLAAAGDVTVNTGNLIQGTAAKGINFTANTPAAGMTSQLLNWYEEGTWTGTLAFNGGSTGITYASNTGYYERVGKTVHVSIYVELTSKGSSTGLTTLSGLPFISANNTAAYAAVTIWASGISVTGILEGFVAINSQQIKLYTLSALGVLATLQDTAFTNTSSFMINVSYRTT